MKTSLGEFPVVADHFVIEVLVKADAPARHTIVGANANPKKLEALVGLRGVGKGLVRARFPYGGVKAAT